MFEHKVTRCFSKIFIFSHNLVSRDVPQKHHQSLHAPGASARGVREPHGVPVRWLRDDRDREAFPVREVRVQPTPALRHLPQDPVLLPAPRAPAQPRGPQAPRRTAGRAHLQCLQRRGRGTLLPVRGVRVRCPPWLHQAARAGEPRHAPAAPARPPGAALRLRRQVLGLSWNLHRVPIQVQPVSSRHPLPLPPCLVPTSHVIVP